MSIEESARRLSRPRPRATSEPLTFDPMISDPSDSVDISRFLLVLYYFASNLLIKNIIISIDYNHNYYINMKAYKSSFIYIFILYKKLYLIISFLFKLFYHCSVSDKKNCTIENG